ncbi:MAG: acylneuraminate cytidylyltransferase family protein [Bacteroidota bacterium]
MKTILVTICARGGSKGIPGKNVLPLNGQPLLRYTINTALSLRDSLEGVDIELSTDSEQIKTVAQAAGLTTNYVRPAKLATDAAGKIGAISDLWRYAEAHYGKAYDLVIDLDVTSPLRTREDIEAAIQQLAEDAEAYNIFSVSPPRRNPYFNMVEARPDGRVQLVKQPDATVFSRQSAPPVYDMNASFYIFRRSFFTSGQQSSITEKSLAFLMEHTCFDLDEPLDFEVMEYLLKNNKLGFEL